MNKNSNLIPIIAAIFGFGLHWLHFSGLTPTFYFFFPLGTIVQIVAIGFYAKGKGRSIFLGLLCLIPIIGFLISFILIAINNSKKILNSDAHGSTQTTIQPEIQKVDMDQIEKAIPKSAIIALQNKNKLEAIKIIRTIYNYDFKTANKMVGDYILTDPKLVEIFNEIKEKAKSNSAAFTQKSNINQHKESKLELFPEADRLLEMIVNSMLDGSKGECSAEEGHAIQMLTSAIGGWPELMKEGGYSYEKFEKVLYDTAGAIIFIRKSENIRPDLVEPTIKVTSRIAFQTLSTLFKRGDIPENTYENIINNLFIVIEDNKIISEIKNYYSILTV